MTGIKAGEPVEEGQCPKITVNYAVQTNLKKLAEKVQIFSQPEKIDSKWAQQSERGRMKGY